MKWPLNDFTIGGIAELADDSTINLTVGDPSVPIPANIAKKLSIAINDGLFPYTNALGLTECRNAALDYYNQTYDSNFNLSNIMITTSATHACYLVLRTLVNKDDVILIQKPYYPTYIDQIKQVGGNVEFICTRPKDNYELLYDDLIAAITPSARFLIINTPNNPTGANYSRETIKMISLVVKKYDLILISDEVYTSYTYQEPFTPFSKYLSLDNLVIIRSGSKDFALAGMRIGYVIAKDSIIRTLSVINEAIVFSPPYISQLALTSALKERYDYNALFANRYNMVVNRLKKIPKLSIAQTNAGLYVYIDISKTKMTDWQFVQKLFEDKNVLLLPGSLFDEANTHVRLALSKENDELQEAINRIEDFLG